VAAAAYRARAEIHDVRQGLTFDYSKKEDLGHCEILVPANAPAWMLDRATLWNKVEANEKRKDAQIMREVEVALPIELNKTQQVELLREFCRQQFVSKGMVADICVHLHKTNPHAHIMLTMREIEGDGFGKKVRAWNSKANLLLWREEWANLQNLYLAQAGFDKQVDHRSYAAQGIDIQPQIKQGVTGYAPSEYEFERAETYRKIAFENGKKLIVDPLLALDHLTRTQSTFTHDDILKYVHAHSDESQFYQALEAVTNSPELILIEKNPYDRFNRYTTRLLQHTEKRMLNAARDLGTAGTHSVKARYVKQATVKNALSTEQRRVLEQIIQGGGLHAVIGHAGTGKSYTLKAVRQVYEAAGYNVQGVALAGVAAEGMEVSSGIKATTICRKIYDWDNGRGKLNDKSVLVIDEAGMVGTRKMDRILSEAKAAGAKVIVVGDTKQTQAVEAGGAFRGIIERVKVSRLNHVWRQQIDWQKDATQLLSGDAENIHAALDMYNAHGHIHAFESYSLAASAMLSDYVRAYRPENPGVMMAHKNEDVERLNLLCRNGLKTYTDVLGEAELKVATSTGTKHFAVGDRVLFLRNERSLGVKNGTFGTVEDMDGNGNLTVAISRHRSVVVNTGFYNHLTYGYAATVHKLQGATIDNAFVLASEAMDRHVGYVALSRHQNDVRLYYSRDRFQNYEHLKRSLSNLGEKELLSDYSRAEDPVTAALEQLTNTNATFTQKELKSVIGRLDEEQAEALHRRIESLGLDLDGQERFSTDEMIGLEAKTFVSAQVLEKRRTHALESEYLADVIARHELDDNQKFVVHRVASGTDLALVNYQYGTDRARVASVIAEAYQRKGYVVEGLCLSGMGARNLQHDTGIEASTIHKKIWEWQKGRNLPNEKSVLIIDNASMMGTRQSQAIFERAEKTNAKVIMFGNDQFLQPIAAGGAYRGVHDRSHFTRVSLLRSEETRTWQHEALDLLRSDARDVGKALDLYAEHGCIQQHPDPTAARTSMVDDWLADVRRSKTYTNRIMLAYTNAEVGGLNDIARLRLKALGYVDGADTPIQTAEKGQVALARGDRIMFLRKDADLGVDSGSLGTMLSINAEILSVRLDSGPTISVDTRLYNDLAHGYAATVYRSAGIRAENTYVLAGKHFNKHATLAALQCHRSSGRIYHSFNSHQALKNRLGRSGDKDLAVDYPLKHKVYRISVTVQNTGKQFQKTVALAPQASEQIAAKQLDRAAREFAYKVCERQKLIAPEKELTIKVERLGHEQAVAYLMKKEAGMKQGRGHGKDF
jgi:Ti-type conjugative transfer relaxase TraA